MDYESQNHQNLTYKKAKKTPYAIFKGMVRRRHVGAIERFDVHLARLGFLLLKEVAGANIVTHLTAHYIRRDL